MAVLRYCDTKICGDMAKPLALCRRSNDVAAKQSIIMKMAIATHGVWRHVAGALPCGNRRRPAWRGFTFCASLSGGELAVLGLCCNGWRGGGCFRLAFALAAYKYCIFLARVLPCAFETMKHIALEPVSKYVYEKLMSALPCI